MSLCEVIINHLMCIALYTHTCADLRKSHLGVDFDCGILSQ